MVALLALAALVSSKAPEGLALWRTPDARGQACSSCHSPDGIELAAYNFSDADLRRRSLPHLGAEKADAMVAYLGSLRKNLGTQKRLDPMQDRPFQPGGAPLSGATAQDRDKAFSLSLATVLPKLATGRISSLDDAKAARDEVIMANPFEIRIGIRMNLLSEDHVHGVDHATIAHWIPDVAITRQNPAYIAAQDRYLASPTDENLKALDKLLVAESPRFFNPSDQVALAKARSLLWFQHDLRMRLLGKPSLGSRGPEPLSGGEGRLTPNPFWDLGALARAYRDLRIDAFGFPETVVEAKTGGPSDREQMNQIRVPWMWLGFMFDQGMQRTSLERPVSQCDYFTEALLQDGPYPAHCAFMITKKIATAAYAPEAWSSPTPQHLAFDFSTLTRGENIRRYQPADSTHAAAYNRFLANALRMFLWLQLEELQRTHVRYQHEPLVFQMKQISKAFSVIDPAGGDDELVKKVLAAIEASSDYKKT